MDKSTLSAHRADAAYEYAILVFSSEEISAARLAKALNLLALASQNDHNQARCSIGRLSDAFGHQFPFSRVERKWLRAASEAGSINAQRRFQAIDPKRFLKPYVKLASAMDVFAPK